MNPSSIDRTTATTTTDATMRAVTQRRYGNDPDSVLTIAEVAAPTIGDDDVLVAVGAAGIDMGTWHCMTGMPYAMRLAGFGVRAPNALNPGRALAGTVVAVGSSVTNLAPGAEVYGTCDGSFAELARVPVDQVASKPVNLTFEQAAAVPISGTTALQAVHQAGVRSGQRVLVVGASGGVGSFAVQIAKALGAEVTGVCRTEKVDLVRSLGADHVVDHTRDDFTAGGAEHDVILDTGGNRRLKDLRRVLAPHGTLVIVGGETSGRWIGGVGRSLCAVALSPFVNQTLGLLVSSERSAELDELRTSIESGLVTPAVDRTYALADIAAALRHVREGRARGKVVVRI